MKKDILIIRESIGRIVSMLTMQAIKVTQRGTGAYVKYHAVTGAITELNVPYIPDDASDEFIAAIQGFLDHEVGHVLHSDPKALKEAHKLGKRVANLANIVEDVFVERKMTESFRGSGHNLESVRKFYLEKIARPKIDAALKAGNLEEARGYATVAAFRAWGGQSSAADFIKEPYIAELVAPVAEKIGPELMGKLSSCNSSMECLDLAVHVMRKLETKEPETPPPEGKPEAPEGGADGESEGGWEPPEDEGSTKSETDDSGKSGSEKSDAVDAPEDAEAGDSDGSGSDDKGGAGKDEETEPGDETPEEVPEEPGEREEVEDDDAGMKDETDSGEASDSDSGDAAGSEDGEGESSDDEGSKPSDAGAAAAEDEGTDPLADMFDTERDFDKDMGERLSKDAAAETAASKYAIFSTEWDKTEPAPLARDKSSVENIEAGLRDKIGVMQKQLERAMSAMARKSWNPGQRKGRIAPGSLFKTAVGDDRVFRQRFETKAKNTAVSLVVDCSGSMNGERIELAGIAAYALSSVLERLSVLHEVIGFTSHHSREMSNAMEKDAKSHGMSSIHSMGWARKEPIYMPVFKPFSGKLDAQARSRMAHLTENPGWLLQNIDGESVQLAARRLVQQPAQRHIMIVLSDGEPACRLGEGLSPHLKSTVKALEKQGVEVIGIGIQTSSVKSFYSKHVVLHNAEELPSRVMAELSKLLLAA